MTEPHANDPSPRRATVAQLKDDIDSGRTGDKVGGFDPAAAPLGTDDEAAGTPPDPQVVAEARAAERGLDSSRRNAATPALAPDARQPGGLPWLAIIGGAVAAILAVGVLAALL